MNFERPQFDTPEHTPQETGEQFSERIANLRADCDPVDDTLKQEILRELDEIAKGAAGPEERVEERLRILEHIVQDALRMLEPTGEEELPLEEQLALNREARRGQSGTSNAGSREPLSTDDEFSGGREDIPEAA